jgi:hypothetical protein
MNLQAKVQHFHILIFNSNVKRFLFENIFIFTNRFNELPYHENKNLINRNDEP